MDVTTEQHSPGQPSRTTCSVVLKFFRDLGGAHPSTWYKWYKVFNYNLLQPRDLPAHQFGHAVCTWHDAAGQHLPGRSTRTGTAVRDGCNDNLLSALTRLVTRTFTIIDNQLIFYFTQGEMLPDFASAVQVRVPRSAIPPLTI